jgi:hypothetical protein
MDVADREVGRRDIGVVTQRLLELGKRFVITFFLQKLATLHEEFTYTGTPLQLHYSKAFAPWSPTSAIPLIRVIVILVICHTEDSSPTSCFCALLDPTNQSAVAAPPLPCTYIEVHGVSSRVQSS